MCHVTRTSLLTFAFILAVSFALDAEIDNWKHVSVSADIAPEPAATDLDLSIADAAQENAKADIALGENAKTGATLGKNANRRRRSYAASSNGGCPTGANWIKSVEVASVTRDKANTRYAGRNAASTSQSVKIYQLVVSTVNDAVAKAAAINYNDEYSKGEYPGTAAVMGLHNEVVKKYNQGDYTHDKNKNIDENNDLKFGQGSLTRDSWWKLGDNCFAMASYSEIKQDSDDEFKPEGTFAKAINLRIAKLTVCKLSECQEQKIVMDCWIEDTGSNWEQCDHFQDESFIASVVARG